MPKITVIMPSLNVKNYIRSCIESVLDQSFRDIEVLAIDAGSTDGTLEILEQCAEEDSRICVIHSDQRSYGHQINLGIEMAVGEYVGIVETDDVIARDMYQILYQTVSENRVEYVKCGFSSFVETDSGLRWFQKGGRCIADKDLIGRIISPRNMPELAIQDYYLWAGIYRKSLLKDIRLSETPGASFQDIGFIYQVLSTADRAVYLDDELYFYRQTKENSSFHKNGFQYLVREYTCLSRVLPSKSDVWVHAFYARMFRQTIGRLQKMAVHGVYWKESENDLNVLLKTMRRAELGEVFQPDQMSEDNRRIYDTLQENAYDVFLDEYAVLAPKIEKLHILLNYIGNREIVIYGCGNYGKYTHILLEMHKPGQIRAFCDNNKRIWNTGVQGVKVIDPEKAVLAYPDAIYVTANLRDWDGIYGQLLTLGIGENQICRYQPDIDIRLFLI